MDIFASTPDAKSGINLLPGKTFHLFIYIYTKYKDLMMLKM